MSKYGGSEKQHKLFVAAYNKAEALVSLRSSPRPASSSAAAASSTSPLLGLHRAREWCAVGVIGEDSPCWMLQDPRRAASLLLRHLLPRQIELSAPFDTPPPPSPAQQQHAVSWCAPSPLSADRGDRIRLWGVVNVLIMWRPGDGSMHTLKHGSWRQTKMSLLLIFFPRMEHTEPSLFALWS